ncbi:MAG: DUF7948 domain-containing protein, partial [Planctomycetota bacterium]
MSSSSRSARRQSSPASRPGTRLHLEPLEPRVLLSGSDMAIEVFGTSPALFVENQGQWDDPSLHYVFQGDGANVAHTDAGPVFQVLDQEMAEDDLVTRSTQFSVRFDGANEAIPVGRDQSDSVFNYCVGDQSEWRTNVPGYEVVAYEGLYDGIDLLTWGRRDSLKYEFHVAPGADATQIEVSYDGIKSLYLDGEGALHVVTALGELIDEAPYIYQDIDGQRVEVAGEFALVDGDTYRFDITDAFDPTVELIVDPDLIWSTYLGGQGRDTAKDVAVDSAGNILVTGWTASSGWVSGGYDTVYSAEYSNAGDNYDAFVTKLSPDGAHLWSTYLGGKRRENVEAGDEGTGIAVDSDGNVIVVGRTFGRNWVSGGFATEFEGMFAGFAAKLSPN